MNSHDNEDRQSSEMNETEAILSDCAGSPETARLVQDLESMLCSHYSNGEVMSALVTLFTAQHVAMHLTASPDGSLCKTCMRIRLTETFQVIRKLVDREVHGLPDHPHTAEEPV